MTSKIIIQTAFHAVRINTMRAFLTSLGVIIGVAALVTIMSLGTGARELIRGQIGGLGSRTVVVVPGREPRGPSGLAQTLSDSIKPRDFEMLQTSLTKNSAISPMLFGAEIAQFEDQTHRVSLYGGGHELWNIFSLDAQAGRLFSREDVLARSDVVVLGNKVSEKLFGSRGAIGEKIKIKQRNFLVIAVLAEKGQSSLADFDESMLIPYTTAQKYFFPTTHFNRIFVMARDEASVPHVKKEITSLLRGSHDILDADKDDFHVHTQVELLDSVSKVMSVLTIFLSSVAAISLIVGGIGIMNIMLVSVTERTREIGLRKAVGARRVDILRQFLCEAMLMTTVGGIVGIVVGAAISGFAAFAITRFAEIEWQYAFPYGAAMLGFVVSIFVGVMFGYMPAQRAASKNPIDALRYE